ncbi:MAG: bifunctional phosphoribosylaminoimidazolecarboxamide formyltransferase/IMP cyclohydrolase, partial [Bacillota bacterium]|nr:bifunctional phosphoribosylaminoimidazolecarboxamide formyltransferase/IMP cyclohydrolase [Bacillota bacterium]
MQKRALISVSNKRGIVELAQGLVELGYEIVSTGGTAKTLLENQVPVTKVSEITGFPEILEGRVKTLHPKIHGGILAKRTAEHLKQIADNDITPIDLVVVNLYPFQETIAKEGVTLAEAIENIDIGGPAMVRAAAKNYQDIAIVVNPDRYEEIVVQLREKESLPLDLRFKLALEAFSHTADYDAAIAGYLKQLTVEEEEVFPEVFELKGVKLNELRYGENPHQRACYYKVASPQAAIVGANKLQGKELSFNNILDADAALAIIKEYKEPAVVVIKHNNPCGISEAADLLTAYEQAYGADPVSAFGGIVAVNRTVDKAVAEEMQKTFLEVIIAPEFTEDALAILSAKANIRLLAIEKLAVDNLSSLTSETALEIKSIAGGFLVQEKDKAMVGEADLQVVTKAKPDAKMLKELLFAWKAVKHVKSNAIVIAKEGITIGVGAGQMNRVGSAKIAIQ